MLHRIKAKAECIGEAGLRHFQALTDALYIYLRGNGDFVTYLFSGEKGVDLVEAGHQVLEKLGHI